MQVVADVEIVDVAQLIVVASTDETFAVDKTAVLTAVGDCDDLELADFAVVLAASPSVHCSSLESSPRGNW